MLANIRGADVPSSSTPDPFNDGPEEKSTHQRSSWGQANPHGLASSGADKERVNMELRENQRQLKVVVQDVDLNLFVLLSCILAWEVFLTWCVEFCFVFLRLYAM